LNKHRRHNKVRTKRAHNKRKNHGNRNDNHPPRFNRHFFRDAVFFDVHKFADFFAANLKQKWQSRDGGDNGRHL
jgi:hypothetical protein